MAPGPASPEEFFAGHRLGATVYTEVVRRLAGMGDFEVRASTSQVAFRRRRGFAYLWLPGRYLRNPAAEVVLTIVLGRADPSPRFKEVVQPSPRHWTHHLEVAAAEDIDDQVTAWLQEAFDRAG